MHDSSTATRRLSAAGTLLLLAALLPPGPARAQSRPGWRLGLVTGRTWVAQSDVQSSPLHYGGAGLAFGLHYARTSPASLIIVEAGADFPALTSGITTGPDHTESMYAGALGVRYGRRNGMRHLGGRLQWEGAYRQHTYTRGLTEHYVEWFAWIGPWVRWERERPEGRSLSAEFSFALAAALMRTPWTGLKYTPDLAFALPNRLQIVEGRFGYRFPIGGRTEGGLHYRIQLLRDRGDFTLARVQHTFTLSFSLVPGAVR